MHVLRRPLIVMALACLGLLPVTGKAQDSGGVAERLQQTPQVLQRFSNIPIKLDTPALAPGRKSPTNQAELEAFIARLPKDHVSVLDLGRTPGGRTIPALLVSREGAKTPMDLRNLARPVVLLIGQQHGNEPAGADALLAVASSLTSGEMQGLLERISLVIIPRANPDGAATDRRDNAGGNDINRDHGLLSQPEIRLIHALVRQVPPALVIDAHEFTVGRRWVEKLGGLQAVDLMLLSATHPMVPQPLRQMADESFQPAIEAALAPYNLKSFVYHTMSTRAGDRSISIGGNAPGIARNAFGLMGAVSFLFETRGVGIGFESYQRRVATHYIAIKAALVTAAQRSADLKAVTESVRTSDTHATDDIIISHSVATRSVELPLIDATTGADKNKTVSMLDTRLVTGSETRGRPAGYLLAADRASAVATRLGLMGARLCTLSRAADLDVERYDIVSRASSDRRAINPEKSLSVRLRPDRGTFEAGTVFVPLDRFDGTRIALTLEPDAPGSLSALELVTETSPPTLAVTRLPYQAMNPALTEAMSCVP